MVSAVRRLGRYALHRQIAAGGMASVHLGRLIGPAGFSRTVAIKRLHPQLAQDASFVAMFLDEARVTGRIVHPNIVSTIDVVQERGELFIVMDFVQGAALSTLFNASVDGGQAIDPAVAVGVVANALGGLHAAHEAVGEGRRPLEVIHRDVSPHNILVGTDGIARIADFGIAKAVGRMQSTTQGQLKGKLSYMAPEVIRGQEIDRRIDVYGAAVVLWELLVGDRLFKGNEASILYDALESEVEPPSQKRPELPAALDAIVLKGLAKKREDRFATAAEFADALEHALAPASARKIGAWVEALAQTDLQSRAALIEELEQTADDAPPVSDARVPERPTARTVRVQAADPPSEESSVSDPTSASARSSAKVPALEAPNVAPASSETDEPEPPPGVRVPMLAPSLARRLALPALGLVVGVVAAVVAFLVATPGDSGAGDPSHRGEVVAASASQPPMSPSPTAATSGSAAPEASPSRQEAPVSDVASSEPVAIATSLTATRTTPAAPASVVPGRLRPPQSSPSTSPPPSAPTSDTPRAPLPTPEPPVL